MTAKKWIIATVLGLILIGSIISFVATKSTENANVITGNTVQKAAGDVFLGQISNVKVEPGTVQGMGVYDRSCKMESGGLTSCDAGIKTKEYGVLNFKYTHNMQEKPCLAQNDLVTVKIVDTSGKAEIQRIY